VTTLLTEHLREQALAYGERIAYTVVDGGSMTFGQWESESNRLARSLVAIGVKKGDRISIYVCAEDALRFMVAYSAVHKAGAVAVPTNTRLVDVELERLLEHAGPSVVLTDPELSPLAQKVAASVPSVHHVVVAPDSAETGEPAWSWGDLSGHGTGKGFGKGPEDTRSFQVQVSGEDLADILYTSGTTGTPKGVAIRHRNVALIPGAPNPSYSGRCWLHASPLFTFAGIGFVYNPMQLGLYGVYQPRFDAARWLDVVEEKRPQFVFLVPSMAQLIAAHPRFSEADLSSILMCAVGSAPLAPATLRALQERMPEATVSNSYGMTEAGPAYCSMEKGEALRRIGSVGKPMPPLQIRIVDEEGRDLGPGEVGEAWMRMPGREREYYRDAEATSSTWSEGWLRTGDFAKLDEDGYLYIVGRKKDVIIRGGNNIHAADVEGVLQEHPAVLEAAVVGVPHQVLGEDVAAVVVLSAGSRADPDELREYCATRLADYKVPRRLEIADSLPRNATGKVLKAKVRESLLGDAVNAN
jgi:acyl-CoA synthetase (AMP-forming)/AMP-acid ligase II